MKRQTERLTQYTGLINIMQTDANEDLITSWISFQRVFIQSDVNELMIRNNIATNRTLTLARITLNKQHQGTGTKVINWLEQFARSNHAHTLIIECVLTQPMKNLALKLGFHEDPIVPSNFIKSI